MAALKPGRMKVARSVKGKDSQIPHSRGLYRHIDEATGEIDYIGQTDDLRARNQQHVLTGKLDLSGQRVEYSVADDSATKDQLRDDEAKHIAKHHPSGNKTSGREGR